MTFKRLEILSFRLLKREIIEYRNKVGHYEYSNSQQDCMKAKGIEASALDLRPVPGTPLQGLSFGVAPTWASAITTSLLPLDTAIAMTSCWCYINLSFFLD